MKVSKQFLRDFAYIANLYGWNAEDVEDAKAQTRANPGELVRYWTRLAMAHRAGYQQTSANNYIRLGQWFQLHAAAPAFLEQNMPRTSTQQYRNQKINYY